MLQISDLSIYYGKSIALRNVSLEVGDGEIVSLLGGNGAGKSTTLRTISGLLTPRSGEITVHGREDQRSSSPQGGEEGHIPLPGGKTDIPGPERL